MSQITPHIQAKPPTPQGGGIGGSVSSVLHNPRIMLFAAIGAGLIVFIWLRNRNSSSSGYPVSQPSGLPSGATTGTASGDAITQPPANTHAFDPVFKDVNGGSIACDNFNGCQFFPTPQGASNVAGGTNTGQEPAQSTLPPSITINMPPGPLSVPGPSSIPSLRAPHAPIVAPKATPKPTKPHPLPKQKIPTAIPVTKSHPQAPLPSIPKPATPPPHAPGGTIAPAHVQPPPNHPPLPATQTTHNTTKPKAPPVKPPLKPPAKPPVKPPVKPPHVVGGGPQTKRTV